MPLSKTQFANTGRRNMIINGAMQVAQRGNQTGPTDGFAVDRFNFVDSNTSGVFDLKQSSTSPDGFAKSVRAVVTTAQSSLSSNSTAYFRYKFEGQDLQRLQYGTSSAQKFTLSYYIRSSVTGTFTLSLYHNDANRMNIQTFTINSADTWEKKTHTFVGDTVSGFDNDTAVSLSVHWVMASGSDFKSGSITPNTWNTYASTSFAQGTTGNILSATSNEFLLTGVQMEIGEQATEFEHRSFGEELQLCQRYYHQLGTESDAEMCGIGVNFGTGSAYFGQYYPVEMRATPTISVNGHANFRCHSDNGGGITGLTGFATNSQTTKKMSLFYFSKSSAFTAGNGNLLFNDVSPTYGVIKFNAEL